VKKALKRFVLIVLVIAGFVAFDAAMDFTARHYIPALFNIVLYPVDVAGVIEYSVGSAVLLFSNRKDIEWVSNRHNSLFCLQCRHNRAEANSSNLSYLPLGLHST
jgi:hypothetical protein